MRKRNPKNWLRHIRQVMRSRHYSWLAEARDGDPIDDVLRDVTTDVMHICKRQGVSWEQLYHQALQQYEAEEADVVNNTGRAMDN